MNHWNQYNLHEDEKKGRFFQMSVKHNECCLGCWPIDCVLHWLFMPTSLPLSPHEVSRCLSLDKFLSQPWPCQYWRTVVSDIHDTPASSYPRVDLVVYYSCCLWQAPIGCDTALVILSLISRLSYCARSRVHVTRPWPWGRALVVGTDGRISANSRQVTSPMPPLGVVKQGNVERVLFMRNFCQLQS